MIWLALLLAAEAPPAENDPLALELLDYRGRRDACQDTPQEWVDWRLWHCDDLARDAASLRSRLASRPDLLARFDTKVQEKEKLIIVMANEWRSAKLGRLIQEGALRDGRKARVIVDTDGSRLRAVTLEVAGQRPLVISPAEPIEYPDIRSTRLLWHGQRIGVDLNFGVEHPWCFATEEGISRLSFVIEGSQVRAYRVDTVKCDVVSREVKVTARRVAYDRKR